MFKDVHGLAAGRTMPLSGQAFVESRSRRMRRLREWARAWRGVAERPRVASMT